jgi:hypothetical protein
MLLEEAAKWIKRQRVGAALTYEMEFLDPGVHALDFTFG